MLKALISALALLALGGSAHAATLPVNPGDWNAVLATARGGDVVVCDGGDYGVVTVPARAYSPPVSVNCKAGSFSRVIIKGVTGLFWQGGLVEPAKLTNPLVAWNPGVNITNSHGISIDGVMIEDRWTADGIGLRDSTDISITNVDLTRPKVGIACLDVTGFTIRGAVIAHKGWDGVDLFSCHKGVVEFVICPSTDLIGANHADCVQLASTGKTGASSDIRIANNFAYGPTQGFTGFTTTGAAYDRLVVDHNFAFIAGQSNAVAFVNARDSVFSNNYVRTIDGQRDGARVVIKGGARNIVCGNVAVFNAQKPPAIDPPCPAPLSTP